MGVSALVVMDNVHLHIILLTIHFVLARGMQANLHGFELLKLSIRQIEYVFTFENLMLEVGHFYLVFGYDIV